MYFLTVLDLKFKSIKTEGQKMYFTVQLTNLVSYLVS